MSKRFIVVTPIGEFESLKKAGAALGINASTVADRMARRPTEYYRKDLPPDHDRQQRVLRQSARVQWPLSWYSYRFLEDDVKDQIYKSWCAQQQLDPDLESTANEFFDEMDQYAEPEPQDSTEDEVDATDT